MFEITETEKIIIMILRTMKKSTQEQNLSVLPELNNKLLKAVTHYMTSN